MTEKLQREISWAFPLISGQAFCSYCTGISHKAGIAPILNASLQAICSAPLTHPDIVSLVDPLFAFGGKRVKPIWIFY